MFYFIAMKAWHISSANRRPRARAGIGDIIGHASLAQATQHQKAMPSASPYSRAEKYRLMRETLNEATAAYLLTRRLSGGQAAAYIASSAVNRARWR